MGLPKLKTKISIEDYLEGEKISTVRHEYVDGEVFAMAGASDNHARIVGNVYTELNVHLRNSKCEPFSNDIKVCATKNVYYYPDILVLCEENDEDSYFRNNPILIIEITSPSTEKIDRREKLFVYQQISSVQEYVIIDQHRINIEIHRRQPDGRWITYYFNENESEDEIEFKSVELTLPIAEIYRRVRFQKKNANPEIYD